MKKLIVAFMLLFVIATTAFAGKAKLDWRDNSDNETLFNIERKNAICSSTVVPWTEITTVTSNVVTYVDIGLVEGSVVCYRVAASNPAGKSGFTNEVVFTVPFTVPASPSLLEVVSTPQ